MARLLLFPLCLAWLFALVSPVVAAEPDRRSQDGPPPWRIIGQDDRSTTSRCIGRPETPLCAVETLLACFQWARPDLCRMVDDEEEQYAAVFGDPADPSKYLAYRIVEERNGDPASDTEIVIEQQEMASGQVIGPPTGTSSGFKLHRQPDGRWKVTGWGDVEH